MSRSHASEVATPRTIAATLAVFYGFGGLTGVLAVVGAAPAGVGQAALLGIGVVALVLAAVAD